MDNCAPEVMGKDSQAQKHNEKSNVDELYILGYLILHGDLW